MGKLQRTKGAVYEREIAERFSAAVGVPIKRNIGQARDGGNDLDVGPLVVECKRRKTLTTIEGWMAQARAAAGRRSVDPSDFRPIPVVVCRADQGMSHVVLELNDFLLLVQDLLAAEINR